VRLTRRKALGLGAGLGAVALAGAYRALAANRGSDAPEAIAVRASPIPSLLPTDPGRTRFGSLVYRSGVVLSSDSEGFGGLSGLWRSANGFDLVAVTDNAMWLTARLGLERGQLTGLSDAVLSPVRDEGGRPLRRTPAYDTESLAIADGVAYVGIERTHEVRRFDWARDGVEARGTPISVPPEAARLPANAGFEAVAVAPRGHPLAGAVIAIAEEASAGDEEPTPGWVLSGPRPFAFKVARKFGFAVTDAAFLPDGDLLLLERRYRVATGVACRLRRITANAIRPGATIDGPVLFEADRTHEIDNMEGLALHRDPATSSTIVTLVSDNNFSPLQRTILLEFSLDA
jgi:hypothetical protein